MAVRSSDDFITLYSQIYFACHTRHVHDPESGTRVSARQASILSHLDSVEPTPLSQLASHMGVTVSTMSIAVDRLVRPHGERGIRRHEVAANVGLIGEREGTLGHA